MNMPTYEGVVAARGRIGQHVHETPIVTSSFVDDAVGASVFFKAENFQKVGAFKARGATNAVLSLDDDAARRGVVTHSSGNHGQAVAYACSIRDCRSVVVISDHAPAVKIDAVRGYGAEVRLVPHDERQAAVDRLVEEEGMVEVHPFDNPHVIEGQGTAALELVRAQPQLDVIVAPVGGGGLTTGSTLVAEQHGMRMVGAEPELVDEAFRSLRDGVRYPATGKMSVGDGLLAGIGRIPFAVLSDSDVRILTVSDSEMLDAMRIHAVRMKMIVEPSGATVLAALLKHRDLFRDQQVGAILSGGNADLSLFA